MTPAPAPSSASLTFEQAIAWARSTPEMAGLMELCYFNDPVEREAERFHRSEEWQAIRTILPTSNNRRVLELGAGRGLMSWAFAVEGCDVHALEPDPSDLIGAGAIHQLCDATGVPITICDAVGERIPYPDDYFDYVVCRAVLHHVSDLEKVCREVHRILKPGGRFLAIKEHTAETPAELEAFLSQHPTHRLVNNEHAYPRAIYERSIRHSGLRLLRSYGHYDHVLSCSPHVTNAHIGDMLAKAISKRGAPAWLASSLARSKAANWIYRRTLTMRCTIPGRHRSFLAQKAPVSMKQWLHLG